MKRILQLGIITYMVYGCSPQQQLQIPPMQSPPGCASIDSVLFTGSGESHIEPYRCECPVNPAVVDTTGLGESAGIREYRRFTGPGESHTETPGRERNY